MANIRLVLLFTVPLVAIVAPTVGHPESIKRWFRRPTTAELRKKLATPNLTREKVRDILDSLLAKDEDAQIGEMYVSAIISDAERHIPRPEDCWRESIYREFKYLMSSDLDSVLNVCNFFNPDMSSCQANITQVYDDSQRFAKLKVEKLAPEQVGDILNSIQDKEIITINQVSVQTFLDQALLFTVEDCQPDVLEMRNSYLDKIDAQPILVSNLRNFDTALERLFSFCSQNIREVFEMSTANITQRVKSDIEHAMFVLDGMHGVSLKNKCSEMEKSYKISASCKQVEKSVTNVNYIEREAKAPRRILVEDTFRGFNELIGGDWVELDNLCLYYLNCYYILAGINTGPRNQNCHQGPNERKFPSLYSFREEIELNRRKKKNAIEYKLP